MPLLTIELPDEQNAALSAKARVQMRQHDLAPEWLRKSWESAKDDGLDQLSMEEIDAGIAAARKARRATGLQPDA